MNTKYVHRKPNFLALQIWKSLQINWKILIIDYSLINKKLVGKEYLQHFQQ